MYISLANITNKKNGKLSLSSDLGSGETTTTTQAVSTTSTTTAQPEEETTSTSTESGGYEGGI